jgi:hypothetical protein
MSLKARIRGLEVKVEWLERCGELRKMEQVLKHHQTMRQVVDQLSANPAAAARLGLAGLVRVPPGRTADAKLIDAMARGRARAGQADAAVPAAPRHPPPLPPEPPPEEPTSESPPKAEAWTHDPPEQMQVEKVTWRMRGPRDDLDDEEEDEYDEYDVLRDA